VRKNRLQADVTPHEAGGTACPTAERVAPAVVQAVPPALPDSSAVSEEATRLVTSILEDYASRGVFRGFSAGPSKDCTTLFRMVWHHDRRFELLLDARKKTLCFAALLPAVPRNSAMYRDLKAFIETRHSEDLPAHRRVDAAKARFRGGNRGSNFSLTIIVKGGDFEYAARQLIHTVHEIFLTFLVDGPYYEYMVEHLGLEQDKY
jgi:hypothetical protein